MSIQGYELVQVATDFVSCDILIWKYYKRPAYGMVEALLDANPQLAYVHRYTPWIPVGTYVRIPIDPSILAGILPTLPQSYLWGPQVNAEFATATLANNTPYQNKIP